MADVEKTRYTDGGFPPCRLNIETLWGRKMIKLSRSSRKKVTRKTNLITFTITLLPLPTPNKLDVFGESNVAVPTILFRLHQH